MVSRTLAAGLTYDYETSSPNVSTLNLRYVKYVVNPSRKCFLAASNVTFSDWGCWGILGDGACWSGRLSISSRSSTFSSLTTTRSEWGKSEDNESAFSLLANVLDEHFIISTRHTMWSVRILLPPIFMMVGKRNPNPLFLHSGG